MVATRAIKRAVVDSRNPLQHEGLREHIFSFVGAGHWWFVAQVSRGWQSSYSRVREHKVEVLSVNDGVRYCTCRPNVTLTTAAFATAACCSLATDRGVNGYLRLHTPDTRLQRFAAQFSDLQTLHLALKRGLPANDYTIQGAAESGSLSKVQLLFETRQRPLPVSICKWAAKGGDLELLTWLSALGHGFDISTCTAAAAAGHKHVLCYLRQQGRECNQRTTAAAAAHGHLSLVQWLLSTGCPFDAPSMCISAAQSGSVDMMVYARQQLGCELDARAMRVAAERGRLSMCKYLRSEGCAWDIGAPNGAAYHAHLDTLRWLREQGCPWNAAEVCIEAAEGGSVEVMRYLLVDAAIPASEQLLREMLAAAGTFGQLAAAQWLRQHGANCLLYCSTKTLSGMMYV
jgi:hypothetical protein